MMPQLRRMQGEDEEDAAGEDKKNSIEYKLYASLQTATWWQEGANIFFESPRKSEESILHDWKTSVLCPPLVGKGQREKLGQVMPAFEKQGKTQCLHQERQQGT